MTFNELNSDCTCNCANDLYQDNNSLFARLASNGNIKLKHFKSYWETPTKRVQDDCEKICSLKGVSISIVPEETDKPRIMEIYKNLESRRFAPNYKNVVLFFRFSDNAGVVKSTPIEGINEFHFDFYRCDGFSLEHIVQESVDSLDSLLTA